MNTHTLSTKQNHPNNLSKIELKNHHELNLLLQTLNLDTVETGLFLGVTTRTVSYWRKGDRPINPMYIPCLQRLAKIYADFALMIQVEFFHLAGVNDVKPKLPLFTSFESFCSLAKLDSPAFVLNTYWRIWQSVISHYYLSDLIEITCNDHTIQDDYNNNKVFQKWFTNFEQIISN